MNRKSKPLAGGICVAVQGTSGSLNARPISMFTRPCPVTAVGGEYIYTKQILINVINFFLKMNALRYSGNATLVRGIQESRIQYSFSFSRNVR